MGMLESDGVTIGDCDIENVTPDRGDDVVELEINGGSVIDGRDVMISWPELVVVRMKGGNEVCCCCCSCCC